MNVTEVQEDFFVNPKAAGRFALEVELRENSVKFVAAESKSGHRENRYRMETKSLLWKKM